MHAYFIQSCIELQNTESWWEKAGLANAVHLFSRSGTGGGAGNDENVYAEPEAGKDG